MAVRLQTSEGEKELFKGCVLTTRERNYHDDSDFYAVIWNEEKQCLEEFEYATTRFATDGNSAVEDATPEIKEKARKWLESWVYETLLARDHLHASQPTALGRRVKFIRNFRGRKQPSASMGEEATVRSTREDRYSYSRWSRLLEVLVETLDHRWIWVSEDLIEVVTPQLYYTPEETIREKAHQFALREQWHVPFAYLPGMVIV